MQILTRWVGDDVTAAGLWPICWRVGVETAIIFTLVSKVYFPHSEWESITSKLASQALKMQTETIDKLSFDGLLCKNNGKLYFELLLNFDTY